MERRVLLYWHESEGNTKTKLKKKLTFFFNFQKIGSGGSVKRKIKKKLWPKYTCANCLDWLIVKPVLLAKTSNEPRHEKTGFSHMRKQRRRLASR